MRRARQPKSRTERLSAPKKEDDVSPKRAPRSPAFSQALTNARSYAKDPERLRQLFKEAVKEAPTIPRGPFKDFWAYFLAMLRLFGGYCGRLYDMGNRFTRAVCALISALYQQQRRIFEKVAKFF